MPSARRTARHAPVLAALLGVLTSAAAGSSGPYEFLWSVTTDEDLRRQTGVDWGARVDFGDVPVSREVKVIYSHLLGYHPQAGPHIIRRDPQYIPRHLVEVRNDVAREIPDPNYDGLIVIDYETWMAIWEWTINVPSGLGPDALDYDFKDDWRDQLLSEDPDVFEGMNQSQQEAHLKNTYEQTVKSFFLATINECRALRPRATWGFYSYPATTYFDPYTERGVIGYGDGTDYYRLQEMNDSLSWMWDAEDALIPIIYAPMYSFPDGDRRASMERRENWESENAQFVTSNVREAVRLARGKPVYCFVGLRYGTGVRPHDNTWLNTMNLRHQFALPGLAGARGVVVWDHIWSVQQYQELQAYFTAAMGPQIQRILADTGDHGATAHDAQNYDHDRTGQNDDGSPTILGLGDGPANSRRQGGGGGGGGAAPGGGAGPGSAQAPPDDGVQTFGSRTGMGVDSVGRGTGGPNSTRQVRILRPPVPLTGPTADPRLVEQALRRARLASGQPK